MPEKLIKDQERLSKIMHIKIKIKIQIKVPPVNKKLLKFSVYQELLGFFLFRKLYLNTFFTVSRVNL